MIGAAVAVDLRATARFIISRRLLAAWEKELLAQ
jgi:hypothetical protein